MTREEAIEQLKHCEAEHYCSQFTRKLNCDRCNKRIALDMAIEALSAEAVGWIPCSERLPKSGRYLASCLLPVFSPQVLNYDEDDGEWFYDGCKSIDFELLTVIAWMPLPTPYKGGDE